MLIDERIERLRLFNGTFPNITRREHWLNIYLDHREGGASHSEAVRRIEFERQHEVKEPSQKEIEALKGLESDVREWLQYAGVKIEFLERRLTALDEIRNPSPAGRWTTPNK